LIAVRAPQIDKARDGRVPIDVRLDSQIIKHGENFWPTPQ
jgi:hypothetical protein